MLVLLDSILQTNTAHALWKRAEFEKLACNKKYAAAIFVTDVMVRCRLKGHADRDKMWKQNVVNHWFKNGENALVFLVSANRFLRSIFWTAFALEMTLSRFRATLPSCGRPD